MFSLSHFFQEFPHSNFVNDKSNIFSSTLISPLTAIASFFLLLTSGDYLKQCWEYSYPLYRAVKATRVSCINTQIKRVGKFATVKVNKSLDYFNGIRLF